MFHKATDIKFLEGTAMEVVFQDGKVKRYNMASLFGKYRCPAPLIFLCTACPLPACPESFFYSFSVIEKNSSLLVATRERKKGRFLI